MINLKREIIFVKKKLLILRECFFSVDIFEFMNEISIHRLEPHANGLGLGFGFAWVELDSRSDCAHATACAFYRAISCGEIDLDFFRRERFDRVDLESKCGRRF